VTAPFGGQGAASPGAGPRPSIARLFQGRLAGEGEVRGLTGRVLRSMSVVYAGVWSEPHRALHLDEEIVYADGTRLVRHWAVHGDDDGFLSGVEATQGGRLRGREVDGDLQLVFDRPLRPGASLTVPKVRLRFTEVEPGVVEVRGHTAILGAPVRRMTLRLSRA